MHSGQEAHGSNPNWDPPHHQDSTPVTLSAAAVVVAVAVAVVAVVAAEGAVR